MKWNIKKFIEKFYALDSDSKYDTQQYCTVMDVKQNEWNPPPPPKNHLLH